MGSPHRSTASPNDFLKLIHMDDGCDIKAVGPGMTALHRAAVSGTAEDVSTLIRYGADVRLRTRAWIGALYTMLL